MPDGPLPAPRPGGAEDAAQVLEAAVGTKQDKGKFAPRPLDLPWASELPAAGQAALPALSAAEVFAALLGEASKFDLEWHEQNGDQEIQYQPWRHPPGQQWGGQRAVCMTINAGGLGRQAYREDHRYVFVEDGPGGGQLLLWHRAGQLQKPPMVVPRFRVECAYFFRWKGGALSISTRSGLCGYNGWLRSRIEGDCERDFRASQPRFEAFMRETLEAAATSGPLPPVPSRGAPRGHFRGATLGSGTAEDWRRHDSWQSWASCVSGDSYFDRHGDPTDGVVVMMPAVPSDVPPDADLAVLDVGTLAELGQRKGVVTEAEVDALRAGLLSGIAASRHAVTPVPPGGRTPNVVGSRGSFHCSPEREASRRTSPKSPNSPKSPDSRPNDKQFARSDSTFVDCGDRSDLESSTVDPGLAAVLVSFNEPPVPPQARLERMCLGQLVDVADRLGVCAAELARFRAGTESALQRLRAAQRGVAGQYQCGAVPPAARPRQQQPVDTKKQPPAKGGSGGGWSCCG